MKWPWVSRLAYDNLLMERNYLRAALSGAQGMQFEAEARAVKFMERLIELRKDGYEAPPAVLDAPRTADPLPDEVSSALDELGLTGHMRRDQEAWAVRHLARNIPPERVAQAILAGGLATREQA